MFLPCCNFRNISNTLSQYNIEKKVDSDEEDEDEDEDGFGPKKAAVDEDDPVARELLEKVTNSFASLQIIIIMPIEKKWVDRSIPKRSCLKDYSPTSASAHIYSTRQPKHPSKIIETKKITFMVVRQKDNSISVIGIIKCRDTLETAYIN